MGICNGSVLKEVISKDLVIAGGYKSLTDMVEKVGKEELDAFVQKNRNEEKVSPVLQYDSFESSQLGWMNIDRYMKYPPEKVTKVRINTFTDYHTRCLMYFHKDRVLAEAFKNDKQWEFNFLPKNEPATLLVMRYFEGKAYYFKQVMSISEGPWEVELKEVDVEGLEEILRELNG